MLLLANCQDPESNVPIITAKPVIHIADGFALEGTTGTLRVDVQVVGSHRQPIIVQYTTKSVTATKGEDFLDVTATLKFESTDTLETKSILLKIIDNDVFEQEEYFEVHFTTDTTVVSLDKSIRVWIKDDDIDFRDNNLSGFITPINREGWSLLWSDEFGGTGLDMEYWTPVIGNGCPNLCGFGNNQKQYYRAENLAIDSGVLTFTALPEDFENNHYTSGRITSLDKFTFTFGRVDIRAKLPYSKGVRAALWMQGQDVDMVGWPERGEIDLMELRGDMPNTVGSTVHYKNINGKHVFPPAKKYTLDSGNFSDEFHVFSMVWEEDKIDFYVDEIHSGTITFSNFNFFENKNPFLKENYILFNVAVGGVGGGDPDNTTIWPQKMAVDYIRVYQQ